MNTELILFDIIHAIFVVFILWISIFVLVKNPRRSVNYTFFLSGLSVAVIEAGHALGSSVVDPELSRTVFLFTLSILFILPFTVHFILALLDLEKRRKTVIILFYTITAGLLVFYLTDISRFLAPSSPRSFLRNYYVPGRYYWLIMLYYGSSVAYYNYELIRAYLSSKDQNFKTRLKYVFAGLIISFISGAAAIALLNGFLISPFWSLFVGFFTIPFAYAILKYQLLDIQLIAKKALLYSGLVVFVGFLISAVNYSTDFIYARYDGFPIWIIPLSSGIITVILGALIWNRLREVDSLKYEFVTIVTHKFRTPLTRIKWSLNLLQGTKKNPEAKPLSEEEKIKMLDGIGRSTTQLVELTELLVGITDVEYKQYQYRFETIDMSRMVRDILATLKVRIAEKEILVKENIADGVDIKADSTRLQFVLQTLTSNAFIYTPSKGSVQVSLAVQNRQAMFFIKDSGIGIAPEEMPYVFTKFFRGTAARKVDTEGMGIGLYVSKKIIQRHGGKISVHSKGLNQGTMFVISLPLVESK